MEPRIINCYELDLKQDFPEDLRLVKIKCESLKRKNKFLINSTIFIGLGLITYLVIKTLKPNYKPEMKKET